MITLITILILMIALIVAFYFRLSLMLALPFFLIILLINSFINPIPFVVFGWLLWIGILLMTLSSRWRWLLITKPFIKWFRKHEPTISASERDVLDAGGVWFEKQFFRGKPDWQELLSSQAPQLTNEEQHFLDHETETFCQMLDDWQLQQSQELPPSVWEYLKKSGFWALIIDKKYGGHQFSAVAHSAIITKIASRSPAAAITVMVPNSLGPAEFIMHFGTEAQKDQYLPALARGDEIGCFALTGLLAGSDATSITDSGVVCYGDYQGKSVLGIRLSWSKRYITLSPIATLIAVCFKLFDPEHLLGDKKEIGITVAVIPANTPGVEQGLRHLPFNLAFLNGPISGTNVFVPFDFIPGGVQSCGQGWRMMMECLSLGRGISLPALATGMTLSSCRMTSAYAAIRHQFKRSIADFEGVEHIIGEMSGFAYLTNATRLFTAIAVDAGAKPSIASAITKYHLTEIARVVVNHAMDIHAGRGIQIGPRNYLASFYHAVLIGITVEGANILTRNLIIFGQGLLRSHPYLRDEMKAIKEKNTTDINCEFDRLLFAHIGYLLQNFSRSFFYGLFGACFVSIKSQSRSKKYLRELTRMSYALSLLSDLSMITLGADLKIKESLSARLGDVLSHLYMASAVIKFYWDKGEPKAEWPFVTWSLDYCLHQIEQAFFAFFTNFPKRGISWFMQKIIFPWGRTYHSPKDQELKSMAHVFQNDMDLRDHLTRYCYIGKASTDATGRIELAFKHWQLIRHLWHRVERLAPKSVITKAVIDSLYQQQELSASEYQQLIDFLIMYFDVLQVDDFVIHEGKPYERSNFEAFAS